MRGTGGKYPEKAAIDGITPACAGNRRRPHDNERRSEDHPRVCGEQCFRLVISPMAFRITPACAGNRPQRPGIRRSRRDHPRVCGEQQFWKHWRKRQIGSPPRVRGTATRTWSLNVLRRITPACAGNRMRGRAAPQAVKDHPRVCGEQCHFWSGHEQAIGSPPRVRGTVSENSEIIIASRITPACAGNRFIA